LRGSNRALGVVFIAGVLSGAGLALATAIAVGVAMAAPAIPKYWRNLRRFMAVLWGLGICVLVCSTELVLFKYWLAEVSFEFFVGEVACVVGGCDAFVKDVDSTNTETTSPAY